jgi:hypothetical protein
MVRIYYAFVTTLLLSSFAQASKEQQGIMFDTRNNKQYIATVSTIRPPQTTPALDHTSDHPNVLNATNSSFWGSSSYTTTSSHNQTPVAYVTTMQETPFGGQVAVTTPLDQDEACCLCCCCCLYGIYEIIARNT